MKNWKSSIGKLIGLLFLLIWSMPILYLFSAFDGEKNEVWQHIISNLALDYSLGSLKMLIGTAIGTLLLGIPTAWVVSTTDFYGRRFFEWILILPLAIPAYILAYTYASSTSYTGAVGIFLRELSPNQNFRIDIMTDGGAILIMSLALYPYVYAVSKTAFRLQLGSVWEASRMLGKSSVETFWKVALPMARPFIVGGLLLVMMEVLNEYGTFKYYGVQTFTTGIFSAWSKFGDVKAALRLALCLLLIIIVLVVLEQQERKRMAFHDEKNTSTLQRKKLKFVQQLLAIGICIIPFILGFAFPVLQLIVWAVQELSGGFRIDELQTLFFNSLTVSSTSAFVVLCIALVLSLYQRHLHQKSTSFSFSKLVGKIATMGYAVPGAVIAVGVLGVFLWLDKRFIRILNDVFSIQSGFIISGTLISLIFAYTVRFLAVGVQPIEGGLSKIGKSLEAASRILGKTSTQTFFKVTLPLLRPAMLTALLLVFVDVSKELPLTLILRPFNYDTLATKAYELADQEFVSQASLPALLIIAISLLPAILLSRLGDKK